MSDEQVHDGLVRAGLPPDDEVAGEPRWFRDYGFQALRMAYLQGLVDGHQVP